MTLPLACDVATLAKSVGESNINSDVERLQAEDECHAKLDSLTRQAAHVLANVATKRLRIAIIEDNADSRTTLKTLLELDGHEVRAAGDGHQGVDLILTWQPDVALVDIGLPGLDGYELARRVRSQKPMDAQRPRMLLIALTGYGLASDRDKVFAAGFDCHLVKPLKVNDLNQILNARSS